MYKKLPEKMFVVDNKDKEFHEKWYDGRSKGNIPHPFRAVLLGSPNVGKSNTAKNLLLKQWPPFQQIIVCHCDPEYTKEYDDVNCILLGEIPSPEDFVGDRKTAVILDDLEFKEMSKQQRFCLNRLFGNVSTHKNISVILCAQDPFNVPALVRRCSNLWCLYQMDDTQQLKSCLSRAGLPLEKYKKLLPLMQKKTDFLVIDKTKGTPYPLRLNIYDVIEEKVKEVKKPISQKLDYDPYRKLSVKEILGKK